MLNLPPIYVLRHGETEWNREMRMQGGLDSALTEAGRAQAVSMAEWLKGRVDGYALFSSPQGRAVATAEPISELTGITLQTDDRLREINMGLWSGLSRDEIDARWPATDPLEDFVDFYERAPEGEGFAALWDRTGEFLRELASPAIIVTHGFTSRFLRIQAVGLGMDQLRELDGGQGCIFEIRDGKHTKIFP
ncbi:histidine phosphatase family protein [Marivivens aquimaris]|uniref:histidine phosphatase family protein n=1 Tax=Marivivens aquimaris TaxID=2774876 RepID=UPI00187F46FD|nr:histidine phosphatase family protein [Marivivens aquimaris]